MSGIPRSFSVFFNELLSAFLGLVQDGEGLVFTKCISPILLLPQVIMLFFEEVQYRHRPCLVLEGTGCRVDGPRVFWLQHSLL